MGVSQPIHLTKPNKRRVGKNVESGKTLVESGKMYAGVVEKKEASRGTKEASQEQKCTCAEKTWAKLEKHWCSSVSRIGFVFPGYVFAGSDCVGRRFLHGIVSSGNGWAGKRFHWRKVLLGRFNG